MEGLNIFKDGVLVDVNVSFKEIPKGHLKKFRAIESKARYTVEWNSFNFPISRTRFVPSRMHKAVIKRLKECRAECEGLLKTLGISATGVLSWDVYEIALSRLEGNSEKYIAQTKQELETFLEESLCSLRIEAIDISEKVLHGIEEQGKNVNKRTLKYVRDFVNRFDAMDFVGDSKLSKLLQSLKVDFLDTVTEERMAYRQESVKELLRRRMEGVSKAATDPKDIPDLIAAYWASNP